jgi:diadenosine tetraphosphate (Ap4A) HIT family hydrolase
MHNCDFCHIRDNPHEGVIAQTAHSIAFMDKHPIAEGHCLVTTRTHHESLMEVPDAELLDLFKVVARVEKAILAAGLGDGVDMRQHFRPYLPEGKYVKRHVHVHLLPRRDGDDVFTQVAVKEMGLRTEPAEKDLFATASLIRKELK